MKKSIIKIPIYRKTYSTLYSVYENRAINSDGISFLRWEKIWEGELPKVKVNEEIYIDELDLGIVVDSTAISTSGTVIYYGNYNSRKEIETEQTILEYNKSETETIQYNSQSKIKKFISNWL